jgi:hypothetical protein
MNRLIGPTGTKIVISCLPLFVRPNTEHTGNHTRPTGTRGWVQFNQSQSVTSESKENEADNKHNDSNGAQSVAMIAQSVPVDTTSYLDPLPNLDDIFSQSTTDNVFDYLDPFSNSQIVKNSSNNNGFDVSTKGSEDVYDSDDFIDDSSDHHEGLTVNYVPQLSIPHRAASISFKKQTSTASNVSLNHSTITPLPPPPPTIHPQYEEKGGWLIKLSHQKGVFGDRWQKRYFILNRMNLTYFKKYGDSKPRGTISLLPGTWCKPIIPGSPRMIDAVAKSAKVGIISVNRCLAVHKPDNYAASLSALLDSEGVIEAFSSMTIALSNPSDVSRTFYMIAPSEQERHSWVDAISHNIMTYCRSSEALDVACSELRCMLKSVGCTITDNLPSILLLLYMKRDLVTKIDVTLPRK